MNILAICSALNNSYIAVNYEDKTISKVIKTDKNYHSLYIIKEIEKLKKENNIDLKNLNAITVNCGPGSFTGIRVALSIAKVMAFQLNIPLIPLNTPEILLKAYDNCNCLLMDARRDMYFCCTKEEIELVYKDKIKDKIKNKIILSDQRCFEKLQNSICYETTEKNLGPVMIKLASDKYRNSKNSEEFNPANVKANYIQTPPVF